MSAIKRYIILTCFCMTLILCVQAQSGSASFGFLNLPFSARLNSLGTNNVSISDGELSMALNNPSLLSDATDKKLQLNYAYYMSSIHFGSVMYSHNYKLNRFAAAVHYLDYGTMQYANELGERMEATFGARDVLIDLIYARQLGKYFSIGVALKPIYSAYEGYTSFALGADVGAHFQTKDRAFQLGLTLQNIGWQLKKFYENADGGSRAMLPMNLQLGFDYHFKHAPIRVGMTIHNMQRWNLGYERSGKSTYVLTSKKGMTSEEWALAQDNGAVMWYDMALRHTIFFLDIVPQNERFYLTISYNHRHRAELAIKDQRSLAGFAIGAGLNLKQVRLGFAFSQYSKGQYIYQFSLTMDINGMLDKKRTTPATTTTETTSIPEKQESPEITETPMTTENIETTENVEQPSENSEISEVTEVTEPTPEVTEVKEESTESTEVTEEMPKVTEEIQEPQQQPQQNTKQKTSNKKGKSGWTVL